MTAGRTVPRRTKPRGTAASEMDAPFASGQLAKPAVTV